MDGYELARALEIFAEAQGFVAPQAYYIVGEFNLTDAEGNSVYSDEAHLWCRGCADTLLARAHAILPPEKHEDNFVCATDARSEDTCPHCMSCGETLDGSVSSYAVSEEVDHYTANPIGDEDTINPRQAVEIAMILYAAPNDADVLAIGRTALARIEALEAEVERQAHTLAAYKAMLAQAEQDVLSSLKSEDRPTGHVSIAHDGFAGDIIGHCLTREGKRGVVVQQDGTRVVHVYGEKWIKPASSLEDSGNG